MGGMKPRRRRSLKQWAKNLFNKKAEKPIPAPPPSAVAFYFTSNLMKQSTYVHSAPVEEPVMASPEQGCNICTNCDKAYLRVLTASSHFCGKDCQTAWSLRTGYSANSFSDQFLE